MRAGGLVRRLLRRPAGAQREGTAGVVSGDRATLFVIDVGEEPSDDYLWVVRWLERWHGGVTVAGYSTGGYEHVWDVAGPAEAIGEVPDGFKCQSEWIERTPAGWTAQASRLEFDFEPPRGSRAP